MSEKQYVQHISGQGEKWEVYDNCSYWESAALVPLYRFPKSEYRLCPASEVWRDVTEECRVDDYSNRSGDFWSILHAPTGANVMSKCNDGYRLRKVQAYQVGERAHVFIVEQKVKS